MREFVLAVAVVLGAACSPGSGEYGACATTPDCQANLLCVAVGGLLISDAGNSYADAGVCRRSCGIEADCSAVGEVCSAQTGGSGYCSKDGGY